MAVAGIGATVGQTFYYQYEFNLEIMISCVVQQLLMPSWSYSAKPANVRKW